MIQGQLLNTTEADAFPKTRINDIAVDKNNNLWFATNAHGFIKTSNDKITKQIKRENGLRSNSILAVDILIYMAIFGWLHQMHYLNMMVEY